jgi:hypothetical protein
MHVLTKYQDMKDHVLIKHVQSYTKKALFDQLRSRKDKPRK